MCAYFVTIFENTKIQSVLNSKFDKYYSYSHHFVNKSQLFLIGGTVESGINYQQKKALSNILYFEWDVSPYNLPFAMTQPKTAMMKTRRNKLILHPFGRDFTFATNVHLYVNVQYLVLG